MGLAIQYEEGQTPIDEDEKDGLLIPSVTTREELDEVEQRNIEQAVRWTIERRKKFTADEIFSEQLVRDLHTRMLGEVWEWAGKFRNSNKNIGVDKYQISIELQKLFDDCKFWVANNTYSPDEIAIRAKFRIVSIHCFPNGNGRHSRLYADIIAENLFNLPAYSWGMGNPVQLLEIRAKYLNSLRQADRGDFQPLIEFAKS